jgi:hypothetical protein
MACESFHLKVLAALVPKGKLLCLGYPDMLVERSVLRQYVEAEQLKAVEPPEPDFWKRWHGWETAVYDTDRILRAMGYEPTYVDIKPSRGCETVVDLNERLPAPLRGEFAGVLDLGTVEHCMNIGQAFRNVAEALAPGGVALHTNPLQMTNHGWFSISPEVYYALYENVHAHIVYTGLPGSRRLTKYTHQPHTRFEPPPESMQMAVCSGPRSGGWPLQAKYRS